MLRAIEVFLLPPLLPLWLLALAMIVRCRKRRLGTALLVLGFVLLLATAMPIVGISLLRTLQTAPALDPLHLPVEPQAIVVLSAEMDLAEEYGGQTVGPMTMQRLRYAAFLHKRTGLPVLVSGGKLAAHQESHAASMRRVLHDELAVEARFSDDRSMTTAENARYSAELLQRERIARVFLVTHAWHMPRAQAAFAQHGITATPAPTAFVRWPSDPLGAWLPRWTGQRDVALALHEWLGRAYYFLFE